MRRFNVSAIFGLTDNISRPARTISNSIRGVGDAASQANRRASRLGTLSPFRRMTFGARNLGGHLTGLRSSIGGLGGAIAGMTGLAVGGGLLAMGKDAVEAADNLGKLSGRLGIAVEDLSLYQFAARRAGMSNNEFNSSMRRFSKRLVDTKNDTGPAKRAYEELGFTLNKLSKMSTPQVYSAVADKLSKITDESKRARLAQLLFGDEGVKQATMLKDGVKGLHAEMEVGRKAGALITQDQADQAAKFDDSLEILNTTIKGAVVSLSFGLIPTIQEYIGGLSEWVTKNREVIGTVLKFSGGIAVLVASVSILTTVFAALSTIAAVAFSPLMIAIAGLAGAAYLIYDNWAPITEFFSNLWGGVVDGLTPVFQAFDRVMGFRQLLIDSLVSLPDDISLIFTSLKLEVLSVFDSIVSGFKPISGLLSTVSGFFDTSPREPETPKSPIGNETRGASPNVLSSQQVHSTNNITVDVNDSRVAISTSTPESKNTTSYINVGANRMAHAQ